MAKNNKDWNKIWYMSVLFIILGICSVILISKAVGMQNVELNNIKKVCTDAGYEYYGNNNILCIDKYHRLVDLEPKNNTDFKSFMIMVAGMTVVFFAILCLRSIFKEWSK